MGALKGASQPFVFTQDACPERTPSAIEVEVEGLREAHPLVAQLNFGLIMTKAFNQHSTQWQEYQEQPWGRLFYILSNKYLQPYIPNLPSKILDLGGGNGRSSIVYAKAGHNIVIVDLAENLLNDAKRSADEAGIIDRVEVYNCDIREVSTLFSKPEFDVILCHNVLQYVDNIEDIIPGIVNCLNINGIISLISMNQYSEVYREIFHELNPKAALDNIENEEYISSTFKEPIRLFTAGELFSYFQNFSLIIEDQFGIRCVNDYISDDSIKEDPTFFTELEQLEFELGRKYPYNLLARFFQLIIKKIP
ncbi:MAG: methyltransferase domain-containing protein [Anaerolineales bacterium]|nr:methyltransferase domain-containing protein [Anaerolineales bacterium]